MMGRAEVVDILVHQGVREPLAWTIAINMRPEYLLAMDQASVEQDVDNIIWKYVEQVEDLHHH